MDETTPIGQSVTDFEATRMNAPLVAIADGSSRIARERAVALIDQGNALEEQGRDAEAMALYDAAVHADPQCARAHLNRGNILLAGGRIDEARSAYEFAISCDPRYAGAYFNLGNLNSRAGESEQALRNFESAIGIKPDFADAYVAMANALEGLGRASEAVTNYERALAINPGYAEVHFNIGVLAMTQGRYEDAVDRLRCALGIRADYAFAHHRLGVALLKLDRNTEAADSLRAALALNDGLSDALGALGEAQFRLGDREASLMSHRRLLESNPDSAPTHYALGSVLHSLGRTGEALESFREAVRLQPAMYMAHYSIGVMLLNQRPNPPLEEAAASLRRAVQINPDYAPAHRALGLVLNHLGQPDAGEVSLRRALSIEPESNDLLYELAMILVALGRTEEAFQLIMPALNRAPGWPMTVAFVNCVVAKRITTADSQLRSALLSAITVPWGSPSLLCPSALGLIMLDSRISGCVHLANRSWPARLPKTVLFGAHGLRALAADTLLHAVLEAAPVNTIEFERFLTSARHALLETVSSGQASDPSDIAALPFYAAIARQCFVNEYVFDCHDQEKLAATECRTKLLALLDANAALPPLLLLAVASYFPLHSLRDASRLLAAAEPAPVEAVLRQQIGEPLEEQALRAGIERLTPIDAGISEQVRNQYEQNPYPRWVKVPMQVISMRFNDALRRALPFAPSVPLPDDSAPELLIAGCGTGSHVILTAHRFRGARVLAIDLSLSSISYAKRKTQELGITNVDYAQADILKLGDVTRSFDIIESIGVLHHLADPFAGWRTLLSRLRPGGYMQLGFYSKKAHRHLVEAREFIAARGYGSTPDEIRRFRRDVATQDVGIDFVNLSRIVDFYSTSMCRDLLFHVQEHRLTLGQIESFIAECGLQFLGFELAPNVLLQYRARFPDDLTATNLSNWTLFEADNPDTFASMYNFWIQKPIRH